MSVNLPKRLPISKLYSKIIEVGGKIEALVNASSFFIHHRVKCIVYPNEGVIFYLADLSAMSEEELQQKVAMNNDTDVYCSASIFSPSIGDYPKMHIGYVNSPIGHGTGIFVMYLQLLLAFLCNVTEITLENYTDDVYRAALGIYHLFTVNMREVNRNNFKGKTLAERLHVSEGKMRMTMRGDFLNEWMADLWGLDEKTQQQLANRPNPWTQDPPYSHHLHTFFYMLFQNFSGGAKKGSPTRKQRTSRRKLRSHKTRRNKKEKTK